MKTAAAIFLAFLLMGCNGGTDYSAYADARSPLLSRIGSLDARLRGLLGDPHPDSSRIRRILDTLDAKFPVMQRGADIGTVDEISQVLTKIGLEPVLHPGDSDLVPSLAWERRRAGCVPLVLLWTTMLRQQGLDANAVLLPGHLVVSVFNGLLIEPLRKGMVRDRSFYDSAFQLEHRPYYAAFRSDSGAVLASMLVQAGLLEWKREHRENARSAFLAAVKLCPSLPEAEGNLGLVSEEMGLKVDAVEHLESAVRGDRLASVAQRRLGVLKN